MLASVNNKILRKKQLSSSVVIILRVLIIFLNYVYFVCFYFRLHDDV
jgi:hypothetical protein